MLLTDAEQVKRYERLNLTPQEKLALLAYDKAVDAGEETPYDLTPEQEKVVKKMRSTGTKTAYKFNKREKKVNSEKQEIISMLCAAVGVGCEVSNPEREFTFEMNGTKYKVVLSCPRK